jgi:hypothetical protein
MAYNPNNPNGQATSANSAPVVWASNAALPAGTNNIGDVDVLTLPAITGTVTANAGSNLNTSALSLDATVTTGNTRIGDVTETAPANDTASSGLNGRLQRIAQRLTSLIALLPSALVSGRLDVNLGAAPATVTIGALPTGTSSVGYTRPTNGIISPEDISTSAWTVKSKGAVVSSSGNNAFISAVASKRLRVIGIYIQAKNSVGTTNTVVKFYDTQGTPAQVTDSPEFEAQAREGLRMAAAPGSFLFTTASGQGIQVNLSAAQSFFVHVEYMQEP